MFNFLLEGEGGNGLSSFITIGGIVLLVVVFYFFMIRPQKKQEKKDAEMRNALMVGDEVTTIGGIIGKVVSIKEETFVLETTKDRTKIRFLKGAIRSVDVSMAALIAAEKAEAEKAEAEKAALDNGAADTENTVEAADTKEEPKKKAEKKKKK